MEAVWQRQVLVVGSCGPNRMWPTPTEVSMPGN